MSGNELFHVLRLTGDDGGAVWLDTRAMRFVVSPANGHANGSGVSFVPLGDYLATHPERRPDVETAIRDGLAHGLAAGDGGRPTLDRCRGLLDPTETIAAITPETVHEEITTGPPVGNEVW